MAGIVPGTFVIKCPPELKDAHWQKKKGKVGKLVKTGLGAELKKLEALLKRVNTNDIDPASSPSKSMEELKVKVAAAMKEYKSSVPPIQKQLKVIQTVAAQAEAKLKKMPLGKDARKAATAVGKAADFYGVTCKSLDLEGSIAEVKASIQKKNMLAAKLLKSSLVKFITGAKSFLGDPNKASWESNIKQQGRSVSNSVAQLKPYKEQFWTEFEKFKGFDLGTLKIADDEQFGAKTTAIVKAAAKQVGAIAKFKP